MNETPVIESSDQSINNKNEGTPLALWNPTAVGNWSLIFTPVFGSILILMNWQVMEKKEQIRNAQIWLVVSIIMLVIQLYLGVPSILFLYFVIWYFASAKLQAKYVKELWGEEYPRRSWLWPLIIGFVAFAVLYGVIFFISFIQILLSQQ